MSPKMDKFICLIPTNCSIFAKYIANAEYGLLLIWTIGLEKHFRALYLVNKINSILCKFKPRYTSLFDPK